MPMQQVEYEFPDPDKDEKLQEVEIKEEKESDMIKSYTMQMMRILRTKMR